MISLEDLTPNTHYFSMNFIFRSYPSHPWLAKWSFEPRDHWGLSSNKSGGHVFQTMETVGQIWPDTDEPEWILQIPIPQNSRITLMFNGFCGYFTKQKRNCAAEVIIPESGVIWGRFSDIPAPTLLTDQAIDDTHEYLWLDRDTSPALLAVRDNLFCLVTTHHSYEDAKELAEQYLNEDLEARLSSELEYREGVSKHFEQMHRHDSLAAIAPEFMMRSLRKPEGKISGIWSQSFETDTPRFNISDVYPLALAWRHLDIDVAEGLVLSALRLQGSSGAIPVHVSPNETFSILEAPKPLFCKTAEAIWNSGKNPDFLKESIPLLRRHLQWALHHFNPKRRGHYSWQSKNEMIIPALYESELATADLAALLITEIDALNRLRKNDTRLRQTQPYFTEERDALEHNLQTQFWNESEMNFCNAFLREKQLKIEGLPSFIPLLWNDIPLRNKTAMLARIKETGILPGGLNVLSWSKTDPDTNAFPALQQQLVLDTLKTADERGSITHDFARITLQGFVDWHSRTIEEKGSLKLDAATAAYIINIQDTRYYRYFAQGRLSGLIFKLIRKTHIEWFELGVVFICLLALISVHEVYKNLRAPPPFEAFEAKMNTAYAYRNDIDTLESSLAIIKYYPAQAAMARLYTGNILLLQGNQEEAILALEAVRKEFPDSPGPMISLGLAYQLQGRFEEAEGCYYEFCYLFDVIFPELVEQVQTYRNLIAEEFRTPPKWSEIYRYQIMHEL